MSFRIRPSHKNANMHKSTSNSITSNTSSKQTNMLSSSSGLFLDQNFDGDSEFLSGGSSSAAAVAPPKPKKGHCIRESPGSTADYY